MTAKEIRTPVHATVALCPPASVRLTAISLLSLQQLVRSMTVCFIMTHHTSALVLSTTCTATQVYMICITVETSTAVQAISVTAVEIRTLVHVIVVLHPPASVQIMAIPSLQ